MIVNNRWIHYMWQQLGAIWHGGYDNPDSEHVKRLDGRLSADIETIAKEYVLPHISSMPLKQQMRLKESFRFALLRCDDDVLARELALVEPLFRPPDNIRKFYERIWGIVFDGESIHPEFDLDSYEDLNDHVEIEKYLF